MSIILKESYRNYDDLQDCTGVNSVELIYTCISFGCLADFCEYKKNLVFGTTDYDMNYVPLVCLYYNFFGDFPKISHPKEARFDVFWCNKEYSRYIEKEEFDCNSEWDFDDNYGPNEKTSFVLRRKAKNFVYEVDLDSVWNRAISSIEEEFPYPCLTNKELYSVVYFLVCLRNEIIKEDYRKRDIKYNPLYSFDNYMYYTGAFNTSEWFPTNNVFSANILALKIDVVNFLLSSFVNRESGTSSFSFLNMKEKELWDLPGMQCLETDASKLVVLDLLVRIYNAVNLLCTLILRTKPEPPISVGGLRNGSIIPLMKGIFVKIKKMESFAMTF